MNIYELFKKKAAQNREEVRTALTNSRIVSSQTVTSMSHAASGDSHTKLSSQNIGVEAIRYIKDVMSDYGITMITKLSHGGSSNTKKKQGSYEISDGVVPVYITLRTPTNANLDVQIPLEVKAGRFSDPSVFFHNGSPYVFCQSAFEDLLVDNTIFANRSNRKMYSPPSNMPDKSNIETPRYNRGIFASADARDALRRAMRGQTASLDEVTGANKPPEDVKLPKSQKPPKPHKTIKAKPDYKRLCSKCSSAPCKCPNKRKKADNEHEAGVMDYMHAIKDYAQSRGQPGGARQFGLPMADQDTLNKIRSANGNSDTLRKMLEIANEQYKQFRAKNSGKTDANTLTQMKQLMANVKAISVEHTRSLSSKKLDIKQDMRSMPKDQKYTVAPVKVKAPKKKASDETDPDDRDGYADIETEHDNDEFLDSAETEEDRDIHTGDSKTLTEDLVVPTRGGMRLNLNKGTKCIIVKDVAGDGTNFHVRFPEHNTDAFVERKYLTKSANEADNDRNAFDDGTSEPPLPPKKKEPNQNP